LTDFHNSFTDTFGRKFAIKLLIKIPPHLKYVATLPCEILKAEKLAIISIKYFVLLEHEEVARHLPYGRKQLLTQKHLTVVATVNFHARINDY